MARRAHSLQTVTDQIASKYPNRDRRSDGWIGDAAHATRKSDHNPVDGIVHAIDLDEDGWPCATFVDQLVASKDPRLKYVIYERRIWFPSSGWRAYYGSNLHTIHVHISVYQGSGDQGHKWNLALLGGSTVPVPSGWNHGMTSDQVMTLQRVMNAWYPTTIRLVVDGDYGPATTSAVRYVQTRLRLTVDGMAGPITRRALGLKF